MKYIKCCMTDCNFTVEHKFAEIHSDKIISRYCCSEHYINYINYKNSKELVPIYNNYKYIEIPLNCTIKRFRKMMVLI